MPESIGGIHAAWISVGTRIDMLESVARNGGDIPKDKNDVEIGGTGSGLAFTPVNLGFTRIRDSSKGSCTSSPMEVTKLSSLSSSDSKKSDKFVPWELSALSFGCIRERLYGKSSVKAPLRFIAKKK